jgi:hypothetical protein
MPYEVFNKSRQNPRISIGEIISVEEQKQFTDYKAFRTFLRDSVYKMPKPETFIPREELNLEKATSNDEPDEEMNLPQNAFEVN